MHGHLPVIGRPEIERAVAVAFRGKRTQTFGRQKLTGHDIKHTFALAPVKRRIVKPDGNSHVRPHRRVGIVAAHIIIEITEIIEERIDKRLFHLISDINPCPAAPRQLRILLHKVSGKHKGIIPKRIDFNQIARAWNHRAPFPHRIHP